MDEYGRGIGRGGTGVRDQESDRLLGGWAAFLNRRAVISGFDLPECRGTEMGCPGVWGGFSARIGVFRDLSAHSYVSKTSNAFCAKSRTASGVNGAIPGTSSVAW